MVHKKTVNSFLLALFGAGVFSVTKLSLQPSRVLAESHQATSRSSITGEEDRLRVFARYTGNFEGRRNRVYDPNPADGKAEPTIGVGHYMDRGDSREVFARVLPEVDYGAVYAGRAALTDEQVDRLFVYDLPRYIIRAQRLVHSFDSLPVYLQAALVDMAYRGDLGGSPKTRQLMNNSEWAGAAREYIDNKEYRTAEARGMSGIVTRMDSNRAAMLTYDAELCAQIESRR